MWQASSQKRFPSISHNIFTFDAATDISLLKDGASLHDLQPIWNINLKRWELEFLQARWSENEFADALLLKSHWMLLLNLPSHILLLAWVLLPLSCRTLFLLKMAAIWSWIENELVRFLSTNFVSQELFL